VKAKEDKMAEDTQKETPEALENEALIQQMLRDAKKVELPSELTSNPVIHKGDETLAAPMTVKEVSSAGYVYVWDTRTFERIPIIYYMLPSKMRQKRDDGSFRFTTNDPGRLPKRGTLKCMLHPDSPNRAHYDELGFRVCKKSNLTNQYQLKQHMIHKHPQEWATIEEERKEREKEEDRALQRLILARAVGETPKQPEKVEEVSTNVETAEMNETAPALEPEKFVCQNCGKEFTYQKTYKKHIKICK
jgi:hypothetical protein